MVESSQVDPNPSLDGIVAVIFDKDGTLIDVESTCGPAMSFVLADLVADDEQRVAAAASIGLDLDTHQIASGSPIIAGTNAELCELMAPVLGIEPAQLLEPFEDRLLFHARDLIAPFPHVDDVLAALQADGVWIGLATNDGEELARAQIATGGWLDFFDSIIGYDSGFGEKPGPGMIHASIERAGVGPEQIVMVGDTDTDLAAAHAAGVRTVLVHVPVGAVEPTIHLDDLSQLLAVIGR